MYSIVPSGCNRHALAISTLDALNTGGTRSVSKHKYDAGLLNIGIAAPILWTGKPLVL